MGLHRPGEIVTLLKAAGEVTRLRLLALLIEGELSVKDFTEILGQSQPRISRHLKLLADADMITRHAEGAWAYYRLRDRGAGAELADWITRNTDSATSELKRDREKLEQVRRAHQAAANAYFSKIADSWDRLRSLHVPDSAVEAAVLEAMPVGGANFLLDLGTGTGRMLELLAPHYREGVGLDSNREMLAVARAKLDGAGVSHAQARLGDIGELADYKSCADIVVMHQVLHYFDDPGAALASAAGCLRPGGTLMVVDFAPHDLEFLRAEQAHRRLGMSPEQMQTWAESVGLTVTGLATLPPETDAGLTVCFWQLAAPNAEVK